VSALVTAELLRLRTVRSPRWIGLAVVALAALFAAMEVRGSGSGAAASASEHADSLRSTAINGVLIAAVVAAQAAASEFKRGSIATTYLAHPDRWRVALSRALTYAGVGGLLAGLAAAVALAVGLVGGGASGTSIDLGAADVARAVAGALFCGAVFATLGVMVGTLTRNPTIASTAVLAPIVLEGALHLPAIHPYLPFGLVEQVLGISHDVPLGPAMLLLLAYPGAVAVAVRWWGLGRDVT
jgi:ABC-2 type transport system permease protein